MIQLPKLNNSRPNQHRLPTRPARHAGCSPLAWACSWFWVAFSSYADHESQQGLGGFPRLGRDRPEGPLGARHFAQHCLSVQTTVHMHWRFPSRYRQSVWHLSSYTLLFFVPHTLISHLYSNFDYAQSTSPDRAGACHRACAYLYLGVEFSLSRSPLRCL